MLALFLLLAGPITLLQLVEIEVLAVSLLAIPGYVTLSVLAALFTLVGVHGFSGTSLFWVLNVAWSYAVALAIVYAIHRAVAAVRE